MITITKEVLNECRTKGGSFKGSQFEYLYELKLIKYPVKYAGWQEDCMGAKITDEELLCLKRKGKGSQVAEKREDDCQSFEERVNVAFHTKFPEFNLNESYVLKIGHFFLDNNFSSSFFEDYFNFVLNEAKNRKNRNITGMFNILFFAPDILAKYKHEKK